jgi:hypothetical protein
MSIHFTWYDESAGIMLCEMEGGWTEAEFWKAQDEMFEMVNRSSAPHSDLIVVTNVDMKQSLLNFFSTINAADKQATKMLGDKRGVAVLIGLNRPVQIFLNMFTRVYNPKQIFTAASIEEAYNLIVCYRAKEMAK